ncbi:MULTISPECIES: hypothetical protein [Streptomyces]|uniref:hypothetical protein n=1 Tax=Streptomyces TaxID=1883 RepID=UPI0002E82A3B|nr:MULTISPECIES: hypothetical protein [Streptomyces]
MSTPDEEIPNVVSEFNPPPPEPLQPPRRRHVPNLPNDCVRVGTVIPLRADAVPQIAVYLSSDARPVFSTVTDPAARERG